jgi:hypothetical protein
LSTTLSPCTCNNCPYRLTKRFCGFCDFDSIYLSVQVQNFIISVFVNGHFFGKIAEHQIFDGWQVSDLADLLALVVQVGHPLEKLLLEPILWNRLGQNLRTILKKYVFFSFTYSFLVLLNVKNFTQNGQINFVCNVRIQLYY